MLYYDSFMAMALVTALDAASIITSYTFTIYSTTTSSYIQYKSGNIG